MLGFSLKEPKDRPKEEPDGSSFTLAFSIINGYGNIYLRRMSLIADFQEMEFPMTSLIRTGLLALVIIVVGAYSIASQAAEPLVGSWRLVSWVEVETESKSVHAPFGDNPSGMITYTTDGHMSLFIIDPKRKPPAGPKATDAEADGLYRTMIAYAGAYNTEGNKVTHKIQFSWNQAWTGTNQQRFFEVTDNQLTIKTPPIISPVSGKESVHTLLWERMK
jgi:lipocalin-like protein